MKISFLLFENYWQRKNIGSSRIRGHWLLKHIPEAEIYKQGGKYDVIYFQKVYWKEMIREFKGIKILDICDPDWLDGMEVVEIFNNVNAITTSTEKLAEDIRKMTKTPVYFIPDGVDFESLPEPKKHIGKAKKVCWFGYIHNSSILDPTLMKLRNLGLTLRVISEGNYNTSECSVENVKWKIETVNQDIQECDIVIMPEYLSGRGLYKSQNKTYQAWSLGMPVAKTAKDLERFMDANERNKEAEEKYKWVKENCDVKNSAKQLMDIINQCIAKKKQSK